jgi:hypothetical protein
MLPPSVEIPTRRNQGFTQLSIRVTFFGAECGESGAHFFVDARHKTCGSFGDTVHFA